MLEILELRVISLDVKMQIRTCGYIDDVLEELIGSHKPHAFSGYITDINIAIEIYRINSGNSAFKYLGDRLCASQIIASFAGETRNGFYPFKVKTYLLILKF